MKQSNKWLDTLLSIAVSVMVFLGCQGSTVEGEIPSPSAVSPSVTKNYIVSNITEYNSKVKSLMAGDTLTLAKGVWKDSKLVFFGEGTADKPILLTVEEYGKTTIEGLSNLQIYGNYLIVDGLMFTNGHSATEQLIEFRKGSSLTANNSVLKNCVIDNYNRPSSTDKDAWVNLWGRNNRVENCYFGTKTNLGVTLIVWPNGDGHNKNYHHISNNYFAGRPNLDVNGAETIRIGTSDYSMEISGTIVESNYFEYCNGESEMISIKSCENRIIDNTFFECEASVVLRHGNRNEISGNYFIGNRKENTGGVRVINQGHKIFNNYFYGCMGTTFRTSLNIMKGLVDSPINGYHQVKDVEICFNTWVDCDMPWLLSFGTREKQDLLPVNVKIAHNIVYSPNEPTLIKAYDNIDGITFENNLLKGKNGFEKGAGFIEGSITTPSGTNGYPLAVTDVKTPAISYVSTDIEGRRRKELTPIGAFDMNGAPVTKVQAVRSNSGPVWYKK